MVDTSVEKNPITIIYECFIQSARNKGYKFNTNKNTNFERTYTYRYLKKFYEKAIKEWKMDIEEIKCMIPIIVSYAKNNKLLNKGASIFNMSQVIDICKSELENKCMNNDNILCKLHESYNKIKNLSIFELTNCKIGGYSKIYMLYDSGEIDDVCIALSKKCTNALSNINSSDRRVFPSGRDLLRIRARILMDSEMLEQISLLFGRDLNTSGIDFLI